MLFRAENNYSINSLSRCLLSTFNRVGLDKAQGHSKNGLVSQTYQVFLCFSAVQPSWFPYTVSTSVHFYSQLASPLSILSRLKQQPTVFKSPHLKTASAFPRSQSVAMEMIKMTYHGRQPSRAKEPV